jgi:hypothetical protein
MTFAAALSLPAVEIATLVLFRLEVEVEAVDGGAVPFPFPAPMMPLTSP